MSTLKKPDLSDTKLRAKLAKGMGHNYYGEPAWPNDLLYIFPVVILGTFACVIGLAILAEVAFGAGAIPGMSVASNLVGLLNQVAGGQGLLGLVALLILLGILRK